MKKKNLVSIIIVLIFVLVIIFMYKNNHEQKSKENNNPVAASTNVEYVNQKYGFKVVLPDSWRGFTSTTTEWQGHKPGPDRDYYNKILVATGTEIHIRDPKYTEAKPRQDIPIMVFTQEEWQKFDEVGEFFLSAAPVPPTKLGENENYVFALPARYSFVPLPGAHEVEQIIKSNAFQTF